MNKSAVTDSALIKNVAQIYPSRQGLKKLIRRKKIRLYQGFDPTATRLHLGHTIGIRKLQEFADLGHEVIFLFGNGTVLVGDPSERKTGRKLITDKEIQENLKTWKQQMAPFIDLAKVKTKYNADWLTKLTLKDIIRIASKISAVQLFKRDNFTRRIRQGDTVWYHETMYPLLQGYDSVVMDVDLEIGGTDQTFNMLIGRELQRKFNHKEKFVLTTKMILGLDGKTMSKTSGNCIWLTDSAKDIYGKIMSLKDELIPSYYEAFTTTTLKELEAIKKNLVSKNPQPLKLKQDLAFEITRQIKGKKKATQAQKDFNTVFQSRGVPTAIPTFSIKNLSSHNLILSDLLVELKLATSKSEAKRLIAQNSVKTNNQTVTSNIKIKAQKGLLITVGKKRWLKLK